MTGPDDHSSTRPISVAELLAKNGTIGAPPVGGRRRRRRGNADAVTVAELTGEIPIIRPDDPAPAPVDEPRTAQTTSDTAADTAADTQADGETPSDTAADEKAARSANGKVDTAEPGTAEPDTEVDTAEAEPEVDTAEPQAESQADLQAGADSDAEAELHSDADPDSDTKAEAVSDVGTESEIERPVGADDLEDDSEDDYADAVAEYSAHLEQRDAEREAAPARRFGFGRLKRTPEPDVDAEQMSPDPLDDIAADVDADTLLGAAESAEVDDLDSAAAEADVEADRDADPADIDSAAADESGLPSYLRSTSEPLFGGQTVADDLARRAGSSRDVNAEDAADETDAAGDDVDLLDEEPDRARPMSSVAHGAWIVGQSVLAVVFGAGLFVAFDQLWKWNNIVALVLSVLVILGLVVGVRVVRKTEDIGSTLIAVAVGALVTLGPLALLQSG